MLKRYKFLIIVIFFALVPHLAEAQFYYGTMQTFGKNRVQYNEFTWTFHRYEQFDVYFYKNGKPIAQKAGIMAQRHLARMSRLLDQPLDERIRIMVFNSLTDLKQSNLNANDDEAYNTGGVTRTAGTRMFVYFNGDYAHLEGQIREGLADLIIQNMLYGGFGSAIKNSTLLNLPQWYTEGLISYLSTPWNATIDEHVMDGFSTKSYKRINILQGVEAKYCGHSVWQYIADTYGEGVIKNLIYMTIISRSIEQSIGQVLGVDLDSFMKGWRDYYVAKYQNTLTADVPLGVALAKSKKEETIFQPKLSQNGRYMAYASNDQGLYRVYTYDFAKKKKKQILERGFRIAQNNDYSYPILGWNPNNRILAFITEEKGFVWLYFYDIQKKKLERRELFGFEKILSFSYSSDGKELLISGVKQGRSDIFVYTILSKSINQITNDDFTDLYPAFINNDQQIVFSSNRTDDSLRPKQQVWKFNANRDLFVYHRYRKNNDVLWRLTQTPDENETQPQEYQPGYIAFLSNPFGQQERHMIAIDSSIAYVDTTTHYAYSFSRFSASGISRNIAEEAYSAEGQRAVMLVYKDQRYQLFDAAHTDAEQIKRNAIPSNGRSRNTAPKNATFVAPANNNTRKGVPLNQLEINIDDYQFDPSLVGNYEPKVKPAPKSVIPLKPETATEEKEKYDFPPARNYFLTFLRDNFTSKIDFVFDNPQYQPFTGTPNGSLLNQGFNVQFKIGAVDLMNDYKLVGGLRTDFQPVAGLSLSPNSEFMIALINQKKRLNKQLNLYRRSQLTTPEGANLTRIINSEAHFKVTWPFNEVQSIQGSLGGRLQRAIVLSQGFASLPVPDIFGVYAIAKLAFVHDNVRQLDINLYKGTRYKVFTEYYYNTDRKDGMHTLGIDFRKYIPLHRTFIFAGRFASGTSFGQEKLIHYLGGVDNAIAPKLNTETPISQTENYKFQTVVTNMRGFRQNIRNGNSFAVLNGELRMPVFKYFVNRPLKSDFARSFQIVGFGDLGTAWNGTTPWSSDNVFLNKIVTTGNLTVVLNRQTNPIVGGFGFGLRSKIFGYFVRADWAWGVENGMVLPPTFYFSLSTDF